MHRRLPVRIVGVIVVVIGCIALVPIGAPAPPDFGDGITQNLATGRLMRTAPLWGLRKEPTLLHDGRATSPEQAILAHDGQGKKARDRFSRLSSFEKAQLLAFLNSL